MTIPDAKTRAVLDKLLDDNGLSADTLLYREAERSSLLPGNAPGIVRLAANASPSEAVIDVYGQGYLVQAEEVGPGLAFAQSAAPNWQETVEMRVLKSRLGDAGVRAEGNVEIEVRLGEILSQGGLIYPVESVTVERVWYCTLPSGSVMGREVGD